MTFSISTKIQDGGQNSKKSKHFRGPTGVDLSTFWSYKQFTHEENSKVAITQLAVELQLWKLAMAQNIKK